MGLRDLEILESQGSQDYRWRRCFQLRLHYPEFHSVQDYQLRQKVLVVQLPQKDQQVLVVLEDLGFQQVLHFLLDQVLQLRLALLMVLHFLVIL